jgi:DNA-binding FrmR family transcriptional regulator
MSEAHELHRHGSLDDKGRAKLKSRLNRIEGQVRGIARMIEEDRYCPDILLQIAAANESLRSTARVLLDSHVRHCVTDAIRSRNPKRVEEVYEELSDLFAKFAR